MTTHVTQLTDEDLVRVNDQKELDILIRNLNLFLLERAGMRSFMKDYNLINRHGYMFSGANENQRIIEFNQLFPKEDLEFCQEETKVNSPSYYNNENGSLYKFQIDHDLNSYEFDIVKRMVRCRKKGEFKKDLQKTKDLIDLYLNEQGHNY